MDFDKLFGGRPTKWSIDSTGSGSFGIGKGVAPAAAAGVLNLTWDGEDKVYSYRFAAHGFSIGASVGASVTVAPEVNPGKGSPIFFLPATLNDFLFESELPGPIAVIAGDVLLGGVSAVFLGSNNTSKWLIRALARNMAGPVGVAQLAALMNFKAVGFYAGVEASNGAGLTGLIGEMWRT